MTRRLRPLGLAAMLGVLAMTLSGCSWSDALGLGWPKGITPEAHINRELWIGSLIAALVVGAIVFILTFWVAAFHRHKKGDTELPRQFGYNMPLEIVLTIIPFLIISILFYFTIIVQERMLEKTGDPEVVVDVTAFQWNWKFGYRSVNYSEGTTAALTNLSDDGRKQDMKSVPEGKNEHGEEIVGAVKGKNPEDRTYLNFDKVEIIGTSDEIPVLVLPAGKRIEFHLAAADVIHAFWVPEFLFKRDVMPDPESNHSDNVFQVSEITQKGAFVGRCAELCGTYHAMMNFEVRVVEPAEFVSYIEERLAGKTNAEALIAINQDPIATTTTPFDTRRGQQSNAQK